MNQVVAYVTDCEPYVLKMGRELEAAEVCDHIECCNNRQTEGEEGNGFDPRIGIKVHRVEQGRGSPKEDDRNL